MVALNVLDIIISIMASQAPNKLGLQLTSADRFQDLIDNEELENFLNGFTKPQEESNRFKSSNVTKLKMNRRNRTNDSSQRADRTTTFSKKIYKVEVDSFRRIRNMAKYLLLPDDPRRFSKFYKKHSQQNSPLLEAKRIKLHDICILHIPMKQDLKVRARNKKDLRYDSPEKTETVPSYDHERQDDIKFWKKLDKFFPNHPAFS